MSGIRNLVSKNEVKETANKNVTSSQGIVLKSVEKENVCDILYINSFQKLTHRTNVEVEMRTKNDNWFPKPGQLVRTQESNDNNPTIVGEWIRDYARDARENRKYPECPPPTSASVTLRGHVND